MRKTAFIRRTLSPVVAGAVCALVATLGAGPVLSAQRSSSTPDVAAAPAGTASAAPRGDWPMYNGTLGGDRYSPLTQITPANVAQLRQVCAFDAPDTVSLETGIVAVDGTLYFTAYGNTYAIDGATCQQKWKQSRPEAPNQLRVNRGVGYSDGKVFRGTGDAHVLALDAATGRVLWSVAIGSGKNGESVPMAPIAWHGVVYVGNAGGDNFGVQGRVYALDAATGRTIWEFHTIPDSGKALTSWKKASPHNPPTGAATWTSYALDTLHDVLYVTTGNPGPDFVEAFHPGDNLYSESLLALDAKTGHLLGYLQPTKEDFHDWDISAGPALITTTRGRPFVLVGAKEGYVFGVDRAAMTQHHAVRGAPPFTMRYRTQVTTRENVTAPLSMTHATRFCPGSQGGVEWNGPSYDHALGTFYVNTIDWCTSVELQPLDSLNGAPGAPWTGAADPKASFGHMDPTSRWQGWITAADAATGRVRWKKRMPMPMLAGITATAGGVVFTGDLAGNVLALDARTGQALWRGATGHAIGGGVISYAVGGKQYIATAAGLNSPIWPVSGGPVHVVVYALP